MPLRALVHYPLSNNKILTLGTEIPQIATFPEGPIWIWLMQVRKMK